MRRASETIFSCTTNFNKTQTNDNSKKVALHEEMTAID